MHNALEIFVVSAIDNSSLKNRCETSILLFAELSISFQWWESGRLQYLLLCDLFSKFLCCLRSLFSHVCVLSYVLYLKWGVMIKYRVLGLNEEIKYVCIHIVPLVLCTMGNELNNYILVWAQAKRIIDYITLLITT